PSPAGRRARVADVFRGGRSPGAPRLRAAGAVAPGGGSWRRLLAAALGGGSEQAQQGLRRVGEGGVAAGERQFEPDGLAAGRPAGAPGGAEQADELQAPAALVGVPGAAATGLDQAGVPDLAD